MVDLTAFADVFNKVSVTVKCSSVANENLDEIL